MIEEVLFTIAIMDIIKATKPTVTEISALIYIVFLTLFLESTLISTPLTLTFEDTESKRIELKSVLNPFINKTTEKRNAAILTTALGLRIINTPNKTAIRPETK